MEWEEQGEQDAEAVQRRPDNISYPVLKCIILFLTDAHTGCREMAHTTFSPQLPVPVSPNSSSAVGACCCSPCLLATLLSVCVCVCTCVCAITISTAVPEQRGCERGREGGEGGQQEE